MTQIATLPALEELQSIPHWLGWRYKQVDGKDKPTKTPAHPLTGACPISSTDPANFAAHQTVLDNKELLNLDGIGFACTKEDDYSFIDLDDCIRADGTLTPFARYVVDLVDTCFLITPGGKGLRGLVHNTQGFNLGADIEGDGECKIEIKSYGGYMTITERPWPGTRTTIEPREVELELLAEEAKARRKAARGKSPKTAKSSHRKTSTSAGDSPYGLSALADECQELATTREGSRNTRLNLAAFRLGQLVAGGELLRSSVEYELLNAADRAGLDSHEAEATFRSGFEKGLLSPRSIPHFEPLHDAMDTPDEDTPDLDAMTLEDAKKLILSLRQENQQLKAKDTWWNTIMANPNLKTVQKLMIRQRMEIEQTAAPGKKRDGKWWWRIDMAADGEATGSDAGTISRNVPYLVAGGVLETWEQPITLKNGRRTHLVWGRLTGAEKLPASIAVPSKWGGKADRCECGGEFKVKSRVLRRQRVGTCKSCGKVRVFAAENVKSELPVTPIKMDDAPACEAHADEYPLHDATVPEDEENESPGLQNARFWPEVVDCMPEDEIPLSFKQRPCRKCGSHDAVKNERGIWMCPCTLPIVQQELRE